mmetsp:Transcript_34898/g.67882  ORF Transcript_34898/g.67882 Transcript_34898/m.67882 type:complete len:119 (+) Transcript_34898:1397-1753(+)
MCGIWVHVANRAPGNLNRKRADILDLVVSGAERGTQHGGLKSQALGARLIRVTMVRELLPEELLDCSLNTRDTGAPADHFDCRQCGYIGASSFQDSLDWHQHLLEYWGGGSLKLFPLD